MTRPAITCRDIQDLLGEVNAAGSALVDGHADASPLPEGPVRGRLVAAMQNLLAGLQDPVEKGLELIWQSHQNAAVRTCSELGVFELVPPSGKASLQELVDKTGADRQLLYKQLTIGKSSRWLDLHLPSLKLPEYLQRTAYGTKPDPDGFQTPLQYGENTKLDLFQWLKTKPEQFKTFNLAMESLTAKSLAGIEAYPFDTELGLNPSSTEDEILLVDVGGGHGQKVEAIRARYPDLKGRMVVQDLKEAIDEIQDAKGFKPMVHDFFTPQPVEGARAYFFCRILHDWSDQDCHRILSNTVSAMRPGHSRILILDAVLPDTGVPPLAALLDINMMLIGGMERSREQWVALFAPLGLEIVKVWAKKDVSIFEASIIEARLKG
ncbi:hypothetical protein GP486_004537 [Trichoglossum hirsutum]|uniref:O-methyltransferase C-terminal domain-containing protein n=1 Tax=Trichoglossum hirsutum TaxID=265104 RepID=A0A9P8LB05_9PEZI|nr:hypothetical protein GP486_004537 [Trichoglossum hirsutum]